MGIIGVTIWVIGVINLLTKSPDPPSRAYLNPKNVTFWATFRCFGFRV